jgi:tetratricopeptide (TPR) repeat protein
MMRSQQKICFVIMGFGRKTDLSTGKTLDLDKTYKNIIKPAVEKANFLCIRADEIQDSGMIDKSMYALLMRADLVVADISTYNPNAIYELGIRHGVKPFSTIIIKEQEGKIPFDLDHTRIFEYVHLGEDIGADEAKRCQHALAEKIENIIKSSFVDSPLYEFIQEMEPPKLPDSEYRKIIIDLADREKHIFAISERARHFMDESNFLEAKVLWEKASKIVPNETYFVQQNALATYKSEHPTKLSSLIDALQIILTLAPEGDTNDPETLGLTGAIYKRIWEISGDVENLQRAIFFYGKGFQIRKDYYNGENYALCLNLAAATETNDDEKTYQLVGARKAREKILEILSHLISSETDSRFKWEYATISNCYYGLKNSELGKKFEDIFMSITDIEWEIQTFKNSKTKLLELIA